MTDLHPIEQRWNDFVEKLERHEVITDENRDRHFEMAFKTGTRARRNVRIELLATVLVTIALVQFVGYFIVTMKFPSEISNVLEFMASVLVIIATGLHIFTAGLPNAVCVPTDLIRARAHNAVNPGAPSVQEMEDAAALATRDVTVAKIIHRWRQQGGELSTRETAVLHGGIELLDRLSAFREEFRSLDGRLSRAKQLMDDAVRE